MTLSLPWMKQANRGVFRDDLINRRLYRQQGRSAFGLAVQVVDWLPGSVVLLSGDDTIAVAVNGSFIGTLERHDGNWGWQE